MLPLCVESIRKDTPGDILLIGVTGSKKQIHRERFAMLTSQQNIPRNICMQINAAIIETFIFHYN